MPKPGRRLPECRSSQRAKPVARSSSADPLLPLPDRILGTPGAAFAPQPRRQAPRGRCPSAGWVGTLRLPENPDSLQSCNARYRWAAPPRRRPVLPVRDRLRRPASASRGRPQIQALHARSNGNDESRTPRRATAAATHSAQSTPPGPSPDPYPPRAVPAGIPAQANVRCWASTHCATTGGFRAPHSFRRPPVTSPAPLPQESN